MDAWKPLVLTALATLSLQTTAGEIKDPWERASARITFFPSTLTAGTTLFTSEGPSAFKTAKSDALAFIGSDGDIRGAQFEQAVRVYRSSYAPPHMSDAQLAKAIAVAD